MRNPDPKAPTYGLPDSLRIPIAAKSGDAIEEYVGPILDKRGRVDGHDGAYLVDSSDRPHLSGIGLWTHANCSLYAERLFPSRQVWVHVDYARYRHAYIQFGMPPIPDKHVLDHTQNRKAIRMRDYSHPYLRLCPVSRKVNSNGGANAGAEGMERITLQRKSAMVEDALALATEQSIIYADPLDITKMLNIVPGTFTLDGVRDLLPLLYP